jgi:plasmid stabilization system protein ParE
MTVTYRVCMMPEAETDLQLIYQGLVDRGASPATARGYVNRILGYVAGLDVFPKRGSVHNEVRPGLHVIGFERRVSIAFVVEDDAQEVTILRILYGGQEFKLGGE